MARAYALRRASSRWIRRASAWVRFNRSRCDAELEIEAFTERLENEVALDSITQDLSVVVGRTLRPQRPSVWIRT